MVLFAGAASHIRPISGEGVPPHNRRFQLWQTLAGEPVRRGVWRSANFVGITGEATRMRRRELLGLAGGIAVFWPLTAGAQQSAQRRIALVVNSRPVSGMTETGWESWQALFAELRRRGWVEGQNLAIERYSAANPERHPEIAKTALGRHPEVIVVIAEGTTRLYKEATSSIPIVAYMGVSSVDVGLGASLARP